METQNKPWIRSGLTSIFSFEKASHPIGSNVPIMSRLFQGYFSFSGEICIEQLF
jgi:hypothetical protein